MDIAEIKQLRPGKVYEITHKSKGVFVAKLIALEPGDPHDEVFVHVIYDVRFGTDQYRLNVGGKDARRESNLRPSKIISIVEYEGDTWLRDVKIPIDPPPGKKSAVGKAIDRFFGRGGTN